MASGQNLPGLSGPNVAPLSEQGGQGHAAGGEQPGAQGGGGTQTEPTPAGEGIQPPAGGGGGQAAQPDSGGEGKTAEERIQELTTKVNSLSGQLASQEDLSDLRDEVADLISQIKATQGGAQPAGQPQGQPQGQPGQGEPAGDMQGQITQLANKMTELTQAVSSMSAPYEDSGALKQYLALEDKMIKDAGVTEPEQIEVVKDLITKEMDSGGHDWRKGYVAKRVVRGQLDKFRQLQKTLTGPRPAEASPGGEGTPPAGTSFQPSQPASPAPGGTGQPTGEPETGPLEEAHRVLGGALEAVFKSGGA